MSPFSLVLADLPRSCNEPVIETASNTQEFSIHGKIFHPDNGGYTPALNYYRAIIRGLNASDGPKVAPGNKTTSLPTIFVGGLEDPLIIIPAAYAAMKAIVPQAKNENGKAGHWMPSGAGGRGECDLG